MPTAPSRETPTPLSRREAEVATMVAQGLTNREIATRLFLSERTVDGQLEQGREKLRVNPRAQITAWVIRHEGSLITAPIARPSTTVQSKNLPRFLTNFIGRGPELAALKKLLANSRMITLMGPGGAGKSRLAAELATETANQWPDGIRWVELASVADPDQVPGIILEALGLQGQGMAIEVISRWLADKHALLILDNCEHLISACALFCGEALTRCPELTIVATSRESLGVSGEVQWLVPSLSDVDAVNLFEA